MQAVAEPKFEHTHSDLTKSEYRVGSYTILVQRDSDTTRRAARRIFYKNHHSPAQVHELTVSPLDLTLRILPREGYREPQKAATDLLAYQNFEGRGRRHGEDLADNDSARREYRAGIIYGIAGILRRGKEATVERIDADPDAPISKETIILILRDAATRLLVQPIGWTDHLLSAGRW